MYQKQLAIHVLSPSQIIDYRLAAYSMYDGCLESVAGLGIRSFDFRANLSFLFKNEQLTHSFIFGERPEQFAHHRSFPMSDLCESLMIAYFW